MPLERLTEFQYSFWEEIKEDMHTKELVEKQNDKPDPLLDDAVRLIVEAGKGSTSVLQRGLRIGYGRAVYLIDRMELQGIVGPANGPGPRRVLRRRT